MDRTNAVVRAYSMGIANHRDYQEACTFLRELKEEKKLLEKAIRLVADMISQHDILLDEHGEEIPEKMGLRRRQHWKYEIVAVDEIPREYMMPDKIKIGAVVRAMKRTCNIPGLRVYYENIIALEPERPEIGKPLNDA